MRDDGVRRDRAWWGDQAVKWTVYLYCALVGAFLCMLGAAIGGG